MPSNPAYAPTVMPAPLVMPAKAGIHVFLARIPALAILALTACAPHIPTPDTAITATAYLPDTPVTAGGSTTKNWWETYNSPPLNTLESTALTANPSIAEAVANLAAANAAIRAANGQFLPQLGLGGGQPLLTRAAFPTGPNSAPPYSIISPSGTISYDPGLFGVHKFTTENAQSLADVQAAQLDATKVSVTANIAIAAIAQAGAAEQIATTNAILTTEKQLLSVLQQEAADGAIPQFPVLQQQAQIQATAATLPALTNQAEMQRDRLSILTGALPADFSAPALKLNDLTIPPNIPVTLPSFFLKNRPDIRAALATVAAQNANLGLSVAKMYPDISVSATGGYASVALNTLFRPGAVFWTLAGNLLAPLYDGGTLRAHRDQAQADLAAALAAYHNAVLTAFAQAADALNAVANDRDAYTAAQSAAATANQAFTLAEADFRLGGADYTSVLTAQTQAAQAALTVTSARTNLLADIATLNAVMAK